MSVDIKTSGEVNQQIRLVSGPTTMIQNDYMFDFTASSTLTLLSLPLDGTKVAIRTRNGITATVVVSGGGLIDNVASLSIGGNRLLKIEYIGGIWTSSNDTDVDATSASNGLVKNLNDIRMGGPLTGNTLIPMGSFNLDFRVIGSGYFVISRDAFGTDAFLLDSSGASIAHQSGTFRIFNSGVGHSQFADNSVGKRGIKMTGFGETSIDVPGAVNYSTLQFNSLTPKKYVDDSRELPAVQLAITATNTLANTPSVPLPTTTKLYVNGIRYFEGVHYTLSGSTITWTNTFAVPGGFNIIIGTNPDTSPLYRVFIEYRTS